jgi:hypothetical protein
MRTKSFHEKSTYHAACIKIKFDAKITLFVKDFLTFHVNHKKYHYSRNFRYEQGCGDEHAPGNGIKFPN